MKLDIGKINHLKVIKQLDFGIYLDGLDMGEILMPRQYVPENIQPGDSLDAFIYFDSEDRIIATTLVPYARLGEFAFLKVVSLNTVGAFLDWGLPKDLLVPYREQKTDMVAGRKYIVYIYLDEKTNRLVASAKIDKFLSREKPEYEIGEAVNLLISQKTDIGYKAIINQKYAGMVHTTDIFMPIEVGDEIEGYIKQVKEDGKIDLLLQKPGYGAIDLMAKSVIDKLKSNNNYLPLNDKSPAETIYTQLGMSKKAFKKAVGSLYKNRLIMIEDDGIRLLE